MTGKEFLRGSFEQKPLEKLAEGYSFTIQEFGHHQKVFPPQSFGWRARQSGSWPRSQVI